MPDFDANALTDVIGSRAVVDDRAQRVRWLGEAAMALQRGQLPGSEARMFVASALLTWLEHGGSLESEYLRVHQRGSHQTPARLWKSLIGDEDNPQQDPIPSGESMKEKTCTTTD